MDINLMKVEKWLAEVLPKLVKLGPDTDRAYFLLDNKIIHNQVFAVMPDGSFIKGEGEATADFISADRAWDVWIKAFEAKVKEMRVLLGESVMFSWRVKPTLRETESSYFLPDTRFWVWGYGAFYNSDKCLFYDGSKAGEPAIMIDIANSFESRLNEAHRCLEALVDCLSRDSKGLLVNRDLTALYEVYKLQIALIRAERK